MKRFWICAPLWASLCAAAFAQQPLPTANADRLHLDDVIRLALERSPETAGAEASIRAMEHRVSPARALPDPTITAGWAGKIVPLDTMSGDASSFRGITVSEQFPAVGKLKLQGELARNDVRAARSDCEAAKRRIVLAVKIAFAEYFYANKAFEAIHQNKDLLEKLAQTAEAQYRVGKATQQDVLRAQVEISMLMEKTEMLEQQRSAAIADLNTALQQSPETPLPAPDAMEAETIRYSLTELYALAEANDTGLQRDQIAVDRSHLSIALAARQTHPDIGVSYSYQQRTDQADMHGVMVSVNIPVFARTKQHEAIAEAGENLHAAEKMQQSQHTAVRAEIRRQLLATETAGRLLTLYQKGIVPQSSLAIESSLSSYQVGKTDFLSLLASFATTLNYQTDTYRQIADHQIAIARMESLTGESITTDNKHPQTTPDTQPKGDQ